MTASQGATYFRGLCAEPVAEWMSLGQNNPLWRSKWNEWLIVSVSWSL